MDLRILALGFEFSVGAYKMRIANASC